MKTFSLISASILNLALAPIASANPLNLEVSLVGDKVIFSTNSNSESSPTLTSVTILGDEGCQIDVPINNTHENESQVRSKISEINLNNLVSSCVFSSRLNSHSIPSIVAVSNNPNFSVQPKYNGYVKTNSIPFAYKVTETTVSNSESVTIETITGGFIHTEMY